MNPFSFLLFLCVCINTSFVFGQSNWYLQANVTLFSVNNYDYTNSDIFTGKENGFKPNFGHPQLIVGYHLSQRSAIESGIIYRINMFNFEGNVKNTNNLISLDLPNSIGVPLRYRYSFNEFILLKKRTQLSLSVGLVSLFQSNVNEMNSLGRVTYQPYTITYIPSMTRKNVFIGELGLLIDRQLSDMFSLSVGYNYWMGVNDYSRIDLTFKNNLNNVGTNGSITHSGTNHSLSIGLKYNFE